MWRIDRRKVRRAGTHEIDRFEKRGIQHGIHGMPVCSAAVTNAVTSLLLLIRWVVSQQLTRMRGLSGCQAVATKWLLSIDANQTGERSNVAYNLL